MPLCHSFHTTKFKKSGLPHHHRLHVFNHTNRDCFPSRFYFNTNKCIYTISTQTNVYTHRVKIQERPELPVHYHLLHVILQWHPDFVEEHTVFYLRTKSNILFFTYALSLCCSLPPSSWKVLIEKVLDFTPRLTYLQSSLTCNQVFQALKVEVNDSPCPGCKACPIHCKHHETNTWYLLFRSRNRDRLPPKPPWQMLTSASNAMMISRFLITVHELVKQAQACVMTARFERVDEDQEYFLFLGTYRVPSHLSYLSTTYLLSFTIFCLVHISFYIS